MYFWGEDGEAQSSNLHGREYSCATATERTSVPRRRGEILRHGQEVVQREPKRNLGHAFAALGAMPDDFMAEGRRDETPQKRKALCQPRLHCQRCSGSDGRRNASEVVFAILSNGATSPYVDATSRPTLDGSRRICQ